MMMKRTFELAGLTLAAVTGFMIASIHLAGAEAPAVTVIQKNRSFSEAKLVIARGTTVRFTNEDEFLHQIYASGRAFSFDSDEQAPGANVDVDFTTAGAFDVICSIHPKMQLLVDVTE